MKTKLWKIISNPPIIKINGIRVPAWQVPSIEDRTNQYDKNQSIITILSKIDEVKIEKKLNVIDNEVKKIKYGLTNKGRAIAITNYLGGGE